MIYVNGSRAYCIQPGAALNTGSSLTQTTSSGVWASLSANQKEAVNVALCYGREGNFSNIKGSSSINSDQCYIATQLIIWEIIKGERNPTAPYSLKGNGYLSMYCADGHNGNIANAYHKIESAMASAKAVPSFAGKSSSDAPLYTLKDSVKVYLADSSKTKIADLTKDTDYKLNVTSEGTGKDTEFNVALNNTYLAKNDFYASKKNK